MSVSSLLKKAKATISTTYKAVDLKLGGILPAGVTPTQAKTSSLKKKTIDVKELTSAQTSYDAARLETSKQKTAYLKSENEQKQQQDIYTQSFMEKFVGKQSAEEQAYIQLAQKSAYLKTATPLITETIPYAQEYATTGNAGQQILDLGLPSIKSETPSIQSTIQSLTLPLLIVGAIILIPKLTK